MMLIETDIAVRVERNLKVVLNTVKNSCPLMRDFGLSSTFIDSPTQKVKAVLSAEIIEQCRRYLPEIEIVTIEYESSDNGLKPKINYELRVKL